MEYCEKDYSRWNLSQRQGKRHELWMAVHVPGSNYGTVQASKSASKIANVVSTAGYNVNPADIKDFSFACASGHNYLALPANSTYKCKITVEVQKNGSDFRVRLSCWFDKPSDGQGNYQSFYGSSYINRVTKGIEFRIYKRMAGKGFHASTDSR